MNKHFIIKMSNKLQNNDTFKIKTLIDPNGVIAVLVLVEIVSLGT